MTAGAITSTKTAGVTTSNNPGRLYHGGIPRLFCAASVWEFFVNGRSPNYGAGNYIVSDGDIIAWRYTCDNGKDLE